MPTFLVRIIETHDLVGIFVCSNLRELAITIDECTDAGECEYIRMASGGIMWTSPAIPIPIELPEDDDGCEPSPMPWGAATFTEIWWGYVYGFRSASRWRKVFPDE
ncbi:hypothetical protein [Rhodopseudomonas sp. RCAM05734]|uniref:hypothetical protein n=1 Tax=Rhodopseudomonas sp. RCAM05734 TaxID=3457549 RepID=UPI00404433E7